MSIGGWQHNTTSRQQALITHDMRRAALIVLAAVAENTHQGARSACLA
jgi:hypothetical protein